MQKNLVIVEPPAKAKTIEKFLGNDFKVMSSYGHIRDLKKKEMSIDTDSLEPEYEIPEEKEKLVKELKSNAKKAEKIWLASDEDREGEAISWHLCEVLGLDEEKTNRIVFHEITKPAILEAIEHPRHIDMNLVNAQQARRVLDRLVGFKLSPVLWRKVKPALSAGRVQSVAVRLIVEREREIQNFKSEPFYSVNGIFAITNADGSQTEVRALLGTRFKTHKEVEAFLEKCKEATYTIESVSKKPLKRTPAPPFTTSTLQQEAHEAIRPTYMNQTEIEGTAQEKKLYDLIWKRTIASQMADAEIEKTTVNIAVSGTDEQFIAQGEVVKFDGFIKVYRESLDDEEMQEEELSHILPPLKKGQELTRRAPTISTIQQREYVHKGDKKGEERTYTIDTLKGKQVKQSVRKEMAGSDKGKLLPTDIGIVVNDFLMDNFKDIMDYNFTAKVEHDFDKIAEGGEKWTTMMRHFYKTFEPTVEKTMNARQEHKAGERQIGIDPKSGRPVFVKIGRFGPVVQIGSAEDNEKPQFAQLPSDKSMETLTMEEAMDLFKLPRTIGDLEGSPVTIGTGRFGPYILHQKKYTSLPKDTDPMTITLEEAIALIQEKRQQEEKRHLKTFEEDAKLEVINGRYGPYIAYDGKNFRLPKNMYQRASELTYDECMKIINSSAKKR